MSRITTVDLLLAGWHKLYHGKITRWAHPHITPVVCFHTAASILKKVGVDEHGEMK